MNLRPLIVVLICLASSNGFTQQLLGPTAIIVNCQTNFTYSHGTVVFPTWTISQNGVIVSTNQVGNSYMATVKWTSGTSGVITFNDGNTTLASANVTVRTTPMAPTPTNGTRCGTGTVNLSAAAGATGGMVRWYVSSSDGTPLQTGTSYTTPSITATTSYYITTYDACTNMESSPRTPITAIVHSTPATPTTATNGIAFMNSTPTISVGTVPGATSYKWYTLSSGGTAIAGVTTHTYAPVVTANATYFVSAVVGGICESSGRKSVTVVLEPNAKPTIGNDVVVMGAKVTLDGGPGYKTYNWKNSANNTVATSRIFSTNIADTYTVTVTKTGVTGTSSPSIGLVVKSQLTPVSNQNYVATNTLLVPVFNESDISKLTVDSRSQTIQYFDGLGRPLQTISTQTSPAISGAPGSSKLDLVQPFAYDGFGRETTKYLPFVASDGTGLLKEDPLGDTLGSYETSPHYKFYNANGDSIANDINPFSVALLEETPLQRALKQGAVGADWQPNASSYTNPTDHSVKFAYEFNSSNEVLNWTWTSSAGYPFGLINASTGTTPVYYPANELTKDRVKDEQNNEAIQFKDKSGRVILRKIANGVGVYSEIYYVYDDVGNLMAVMQPEGTKNLATQYFNQSDLNKDRYLNKWAFRYTYDQRNRMVMKQIPGSGAVYMIYDNRDRLVLTQDANQRALTNKEWNFVKYDILNRPVLSGKYLSNNSLSTMADAVNTFYADTSKRWFEDYIGSISNNIFGYTNRSFPKVEENDCYSVTYYDDYDDFIAPTLPISYLYFNESLPGQELTNSPNVRGLVVGTLTRILGTSTWLRTVNYYDAKHRSIQTVGDNQKGTVRTSMVLDFTGRVLISKRTYVVSGNTTAIKETFAYDHAGRLLTVKHSINGSVDVLTTSNVYNKLGQLIDRNLHSKDDGVTFKQSVDYRYNIRGWMTKINEADVSAVGKGDVVNDFFGMELGYNNALGGLAAVIQYNGNISSMRWSKGNGGTVQMQNYIYEYDAMNRLKNSWNYRNDSTANKLWAKHFSAFSECIKYDLNGNITSLKRKGFGGMLLDNLSYGYTGNRLNYVHDAGSATMGFVDAHTGIDDYGYDANGNLYKDKNKGISNNADIKYNHLNLPVEITKNTGEKLKYIYDASGRKLAQEVYGTNGTTLLKVTDYIGELVFEGTSPALKMIQHAEGRILPDGGAWEYQYHLKDHLGNIRVTFTAKTQAATTYTTNFETATNADFVNYTSQTYDLVDHTDVLGTTYTKVQTLNGGVNARVGVGKSFAVQPGDKISVSAYAKYMNLGGTANSNALINSLAGAFGVSSTSTGEQLKLYNGLNSFASSVPSGDHPNDDEGAPKAFVTILFFDKDYNVVDAAWDQLTTAGEQTSATVKQPSHDLVSVTAKAPEAGHAYVFVSNEHPTFVDVYFDDVSIVYTPSPIVSVSDYYAFGLQYNNVQRSTTFEQQFNFGSKELQDELSVNLLDFGARMYDAAIARWNAIDPLADKMRRHSPYNYCFDNPTRFIDPDGMAPLTGTLGGSWGGPDIQGDGTETKDPHTGRPLGEISTKPSARAKAMAKLSADVYKTANGKYKPGAKAGNLDGWKLSDKDFEITLTDDKSGFNSAVYEKDGEYVYVTQGSDFDNGGNDWSESAKQALGEYSKQYDISTKNAVALKRILGENLSFAGHSLGGGLASANALKTGLSATTFNAAGLSEGSRSLYGLNQQANIDAYRVEGEIVGVTPAALGLRAEGNIHMLPSALPYAPTCVPIPQVRTAAMAYNLGLSIYNHTMGAVMSGMGIED